MRIYLKIITIFITIAVSACSSGEDYKFSRSNYSLDCPTLQQKLASSLRQKEELRKEDGFRFKHMLVIPAIYHTYQIQAKEKKLEDDIYQLRNLVISKGCKKQTARTNSAPVTRRNVKNNPFYNPYMQYYSQGNRAAPSQQAPKQQYYQQQPQNNQPYYGNNNGQAYAQPQAQYRQQQPQQQEYQGYYRDRQPISSNPNGYGAPGYRAPDNDYLDQYGGEKNYGPGGSSVDHIAQRYMKQL